MVQPVGSRCGEAWYESAALRRFVGVDLGVAPVPDEMTICRFGHLPEKPDLGGLMLEAVNVDLEARGIRIATGTIVDATIIHAPSFTRNSPASATRTCIRPGKGTSGVCYERERELVMQY
jgi:IS5 family transposase